MRDVYLDVSCCDSRHADDGSDQQPKLKQPSLLSRLAQSSSEQLAAPIASQQQSAALPDASQIPQSGQEHSTSSDVRSWTSDQLTGLCPVCGLKLSVQLLQQHVDEELSLLSDSNESCMDPVFADIRNQPSGLANRPAFFTKLHGHRSTTSRRHPAGQQKVSAACFTLWQDVPPHCVTIRLWSSSIRHHPSPIGFCNSVMLRPMPCMEACRLYLQHAHVQHSLCTPFLPGNG